MRTARRNQRILHLNTCFGEQWCGAVRKIVEPDVTMAPLQKLAQASADGMSRKQDDAILEELRSILRLLQQQQAKTSAISSASKRSTNASSFVIGKSGQSQLGVYSCVFV